MKYVWLLFTALLLASCGEKSSTQTVAPQDTQPKPLEWHEAQNSIAAYRELQPDRPILASFTSKWEPPFAINALQTAETEQVLALHHCLCLTYPTETRESIGTSECQRLGSHLPLVVLSLPGQPDRLFKPEYNKQAAQELVTEITAILEEYAQSKTQPTVTTDHEWQQACGGSNIAVTRQGHNILFIEAFAEHFSESREWICHFTKGKLTSATYRTYKVIRTEYEDPERDPLVDIELKLKSTSTFHLPDHKLDKLPDELRGDLLEILKIAGSK